MPELPRYVDEEVDPMHARALTHQLDPHQSRLTILSSLNGI